MTSLKLYIFHLNTSYEAFFQRPNAYFSGHVSSRWFDNMAVGRSILGGFMSRISTEAQLTNRFTNHCVRASTITTLKHQGFSNSDICSVTGHKREESLVHYCKEPSDASKNAMSKALYSKGEKSTPTSTISAPIPVSNATRALTTLSDQIDNPSTSTDLDSAHSENVTSQRTNLFAPSNLTDQVKTVLPGAVFNTPVSLSITINNNYKH